MTELSYSLEVILEDHETDKCWWPIITLQVRATILRHAGQKRLAWRIERCAAIAMDVLYNLEN